jgi:cyclic pyranopterin phosphate synthase
MMELTHVDRQGNARMVDVSQKSVTAREAVAVGKIHIKPETLKLITEGNIPKGDVLSTARIAGIMAAKRTQDLIPMCHNIPIDSVKVEFTINTNESYIGMKSTVRCTWKTGVEMEALTAVCTAALTIYDMCKAVDKDMTIREIMLVSKTGGKSGSYIRENIENV